MPRRFVVPVVIVLTAAIVTIATWRDARMTPPARAAAARTVPSTTRVDLTRTVEEMEARLQVRPDDGDAVVQLAEALIRLQRVMSDPGAVVIAEHRLRGFLERAPDHYEAQRMLATVLLSQHRFRDAIREANRAQAMDPRDAWNYGVLGDAHLELGEYDEAFAAFDRMGSLRPGPAAYARVAYALEIQGDLEGALKSMRMAADATSAHDAEGQAWVYAQVGNLLLQRGHVGDARREFERAEATFPQHPYAVSGLARVKVAEGDLAGGLAVYERAYRQAPTPELAFVIGDLHARLGRAARAEQMYVEGERLEREGWVTEEPQPQALARFFAERNRKLEEAVVLAERAASVRRDVHTLDALAWSYFKTGRVDEAQHVMDQALRTGTRDLRLLYHAASIRLATCDTAGARAFLDRIEAPDVELDLIASSGLRALGAECQTTSADRW